MNLEHRNTDLGRILDLMKIVNGGANSSDCKKVKLFPESDIYHEFPKEVTILDGEVKKHRYSFIRRMKAKIELYEIYSENEDMVIKNSIISEIGNPNIFYRICSSIIKE